MVWITENYIMREGLRKCNVGFTS